MAEPFIAQVQIFPYNFAPRGWAFCDGQLLPISQNTALFSLIGTTYGGDGKTTMGLPNLQGRAVVCPGRGPGLSTYQLGQRGGTETVTLSEAQMAAHPHTMRAAPDPGDLNAPSTQRSLARSSGAFAYQQNATANLGAMAAQALPNSAGGSQPHNNMEPYLTLNFCIALQGIYPSRP